MKRQTVSQKLNRTALLLILAVGMSFAVALSAENEAEEEKEIDVTLDQVPAAVKTTLDLEYRGAPIESIEKKDKKQGTVYEVDIVRDGKKIEVKIGEDGKVLKEKEEEEEKEENEDDSFKKDSGFTTNFDVENRSLVSQGKNKFFILEPGYQLILEDGKDKLIITVLDETRKIGNVQTRVVEERELEKGELSEISRNFFAIDANSKDVFYFGEETDKYRDGKIVRHEGEWLAGQDGARPGLLMPGSILLGSKYYQEQASAKAMDRAKIVSDSETLKTPAGTFTNCLKTEESSPLEKGKEYKLYAPGVGLIKDENLLLVYCGPRKAEP